MGSRIVFHTDLDNTLIYSYKHDIGADKLCAEIYQGREISFMTRDTYKLLKEAQERVLTVPTTTRTTEQYSRINLGQVSFQYALVCNGGVLLSDGNEDQGWYRDSLGLVRYSRLEIDKAAEFLEHDKRRIFDLRFIRNLFLFTKCEEPEKVVCGLQEMLDVTLVDVFHNGIKVYVVPKALSKGNAVRRFREYLQNRFTVDFVIAAGDSAFDATMLEAADHGIAAPELAAERRFPPKVICPSEGRLFSEAVLEAVLQLAEGVSGTKGG